MGTAATDSRKCAICGQNCQVVLAGGMGQGMYQNLQQAGIRPVLTELKDIQEALRVFVEGRLAERPERVH